MTLYYKMRQILLQNATAILLQNATKVYYEMRQVFYYKMQQFYYKMRQLLQNATFITYCDSTPRKSLGTIFHSSPPWYITINLTGPLQKKSKQW